MKQNIKEELKFSENWKNKTKEEIASDIESARKMAQRFRKFGYYFNIFQKKIHPKPDSKILDACCGNGYVTYLLYKKGFRNVSGFDLDPYSIKIANLAFKPINFFESKAQEIKLPNSSVDIIFVTNALHHFPDLSELSSEFHRILKSGGKVFAVEPNAWHPLVLFREFFDILKNKKTRNEFPLLGVKAKKSFSKLFKVNISYCRFLTKVILCMERK